MLQLCLLGKFLLTMWRQKIDSYFYGIGTKLETKHVSRSSLEKGSLCQAWKCHPQCGNVYSTDQEEDTSRKWNEIFEIKNWNKRIKLRE